MAFTNTATALRQSGGLIAQRLSQGMKENNSDASGQLDESISIRVTATDTKVTLEVSMLDYWVYVDEGRRAGKNPPVSKIMEWLTYPNVREKIRGNNDAEFTDAQRKSLAYLISNKIGREGTKGTHFATKVFNSPLMKVDLPQIILNAVAEDADAILEDIILNFSTENI